MSLMPEIRMVMRTAAYSIAVGVPLMTAFVWLGVSVARTWSVNDNEPFILLILCLVGGSIGFALLGGIVGVIMATVTKIAHGKFIYGARFRLLVSLIPLLIIALLLPPTPPAMLERFWWKLQLGNYLAKLYVAGWLLAASAGIGVCQMVAAKYEREVSPPKNDRPLALWRPIPLIAIILLIVFFSVVISVGSDAIHLSLRTSESAARISEAEHLLRAARDGVSVGLVFGSAIGLTIMLRFSEIRRPFVYRITILGVTLVVALALWGVQIHWGELHTLQYSKLYWRNGILVLAKAGLSTFAVVLAAELYRRFAAAPAQKRTANEDNLPVSS